jgi:hypothetical protein
MFTGLNKIPIFHCAKNIKIKQTKIPKNPIAAKSYFFMVYKILYNRGTPLQG